MLRFEKNDGGYFEKSSNKVFGGIFVYVFCKVGPEIGI